MERVSKKRLVYNEYNSGMSIKELAKKYNMPEIKILSFLISSNADFLDKKCDIKLNKKTKKHFIKRMCRYGYDYDVVRKFMNVNYTDEELYFIRTGKRLKRKNKPKKTSKYFSWDELIKHPLCSYNK